jgi:outer membrane protein TolC
MRMSARRIGPLLFLVKIGLAASLAQAQLPDQDAPSAPMTLTLDECIGVGLERQPSLAAARASLAAAEDNRQALQHLRLARLISRELPVRRQQANLGVVIASAGLEQAEWETTYAVTRTYFSAVYALRQQAVAAGVVNKLKLYREEAQFLLKKGDPDSLVTQADVDKLATNTDLYELRHIQATQGAKRALAALREAMGLEADCQVVVADRNLPLVQDVPSREELLDLALGRRGEVVQAGNAARVTELEVCAQNKSFGLTHQTFAAVSDIHAREIPQGIANKEYRPSAIGLDMPTTLAGRRGDRVRRAQDFSVRAGAVVDKTRNLIALELDDSYLKWREASLHLRVLAGTHAKAAAVLKSVEARFQIGRVNGDDIIRAKTLESQVEAEQNEALFNQALALAALERITAGGFQMARTRTAAAGEP